MQVRINTQAKSDQALIEGSAKLSAIYNLEVVACSCHDGRVVLYTGISRYNFEKDSQTVYVWGPEENYEIHTKSGTDEILETIFA